MKSIIISSLIMILVMAETNAACKWRYVNEINKDIKNASSLLSDYAKCQDNCDFLSKGLNRMLLHLSQSSQCGAHILTPENGNAIGFIGGRYKLIYKQKTGKNWAREEIDVPIAVVTGENFWNTKPAAPAPRPAPKPVQIKPLAKPAPNTVRRPVQYKVWIPPQNTQRKPQPPVQQRPQAARPKARQRMAISREAYKALWPEHQARQPQRRRPQQAQQRKRSTGPTPQQLARQRAIQQRKQLLIQQQLIQRKNAKKRAIQHRLNQHRLARIRLQKQRQQQAKLERNRRIQQQRLIISQRNRNR